MQLWSLVLVLSAPLAVFGATETSPDPFSLAPCISARVPPFGDDAKYLIKLIRPPYSLELPFHAVLDETTAPLADHNAEHPDAPVSALLVGHGGYLIETALPYQLAQTDLVLILEVWLAREAAMSPGCFNLRPTAEPESLIQLDPYTGNAFVGRIEDTTLDLVIIGAGGAELGRVRFDLFSSAPLVDRSDTSYADLEAHGSKDEFFWFDATRLAPFVETYLRIAGQEYARFVADAFLAVWTQSWTDEWPAAEGVRLPYLPPAADRPPEAPASARRLDGLRTGPHWHFVPGKPRKGGIYGPVVPMLQLLEARDCLTELDEPAPPDSCPSYSAMALQTELYRAFPDFSEAPGYSLSEVFQVIRDRGVCREQSYPMPKGQAVGWPATLDEFARRSEKALKRIRKSSGGRGIEFVDALPPSCAEEMRRYTEQHDLAGHDLVDLYAAQHKVGRVLPGSDTEALHGAQRAELAHLTLRLLDDEVPVVVWGDGGVLDGRIVLAYDRTEDRVVVMDSSVEEEAARRKTVIPFADLQETLGGIAFLRGDLENRDPTEAQLRKFP